MNIEIPRPESPAHSATGGQAGEGSPSLKSLNPSASRRGGKSGLVGMQVARLGPRLEPIWLHVWSDAVVPATQLYGRRSFRIFPKRKGVGPSVAHAANNGRLVALTLFNLFVLRNISFSPSGLPSTPAPASRGRCRWGCRPHPPRHQWWFRLLGRPLREPLRRRRVHR